MPTLLKSSVVASKSDRNAMSETPADYKDAIDWEKKYCPIKRGNGVRLRNNGTLFDLQGEDRKFINRMDPEFIWSVFDNGSFEYIQAGKRNDRNVIGYLVTDNPVFFADLDTKFAIDSKTIERGGVAEFAIEDARDTGDVIAAAPEIEAPTEQPSAKVLEVTPELASVDVAPNHREVKSPTPSSAATKKDRTPNPVTRLVSSFLRKTREKRTMQTSRAAEELSAVPVAPPETPVSPSPTPALLSAPVPPQMSPTIAPTPVPNPEPVAVPSAPEAQQEVAPMATRISVAVSAPEPQERPPAITPDPTPIPGAASVPALSRPVLVSRPRPRPTRPKTAELSFPLFAPSSTPAPDPRPAPDTSVAAAKAVEVRVRYLPFGIDATKLDRQVYGPWPNAVVCKDCKGTGYSSGIVVGLIACNECDGRGWNPPYGGATEITVTVK